MLSIEVVLSLISSAVILTYLFTKIAWQDRLYRARERWDATMEERLRQAEEGCRARCADLKRALEKEHHVQERQR